MRLYEVGGAVRDSLLGLTASDRDWVAVGATPEALLAQGYKPVGRDFPVFLHPQTGEEVALARTERKSGRGYHGFTFHADASVTLEQDLGRRDLTINAMARDEHGQLVDPHGGQQDLRDRVLRHVSSAFVEDPVRLLRVARLSARFHTFTVAPETQALLARMVADGEVDHLVPERVWQELSRGLMEARPSRMLQVLADCGAMQRLLPELVAATSAAQALLATRLDEAARRDEPLPVRLAAWVAVTDRAGADAVLARWRVPRECAELAVLRVREGAAVAAASTLDAPGLVALFTRCDAWRRPERWLLLLRTLALHPELDAPRPWLQQALALASGVDAGQAAARAAAAGARGEAVAAAVAAARAAALVQAGLCQDGHHAPR